MENFHNPSSSVVVAKCFLDYRIFDCLLTSMAAVLAEDGRDSFLFVGDLDDHH